MYVSTIAAAVLAHWGPLVSGALVCYCIGSAIYNLWFSPLAAYPGPICARLSSLPDFYYYPTGDRHIWIARNNQIYGDIVRHPNVKRSHFYDMMTGNKHDKNTLTGTDPALHAQKRRPILVEHVVRWCELLGSDDDYNGDRDWSSPRKMSEVCDYLVLDVLCNLCFGRGVGTKEAGDNQFRQIPHTMALFLRISYPLGHSPWLGLLVWLKPRGLDWVLAATAGPKIRFLYKFPQKASDKLGILGRNEMLYHLLNATDPETGLPGYTPEALEAEALMLTVTGSDTTSVIMAGFFFYTVRTPQVYCRLVNEIRATFAASIDEIKDGQKLMSCQYLRACVDEAMRIASAGSTELPRTVRPGVIIVDGNYIPEGTTVDVYRPERWIVDEATGVTSDDVAKARSSCLPFAAGPTSCAGKNFALLELYTTIAMTLWKSTWGRADPDTFQLFDSYISIRDGPVVQFKRRV
ncbi:benzoate 4-monooxygenase cytochrome P450 [Aspergillus pseudoustus]|uniref:Benzoate 4-monooxygenase cytochrome P450 n=1 Tax=Aspergillus pseudoustus TaxID=1810923 RepID=A0ABR4ICS5_9EURO